MPTVPSHRRFDDQDTRQGIHAEGDTAPIHLAQFAGTGGELRPRRHCQIEHVTQAGTAIERYTHVSPPTRGIHHGAVFGLVKEEPTTEGGACFYSTKSDNVEEAGEGSD